MTDGQDATRRSDDTERCRDARAEQGKTKVPRREASQGRYHHDARHRRGTQGRYPDPRYPDPRHTGKVPRREDTGKGTATPKERYRDARRTGKVPRREDTGKGTRRESLAAGRTCVATARASRRYREATATIRARYHDEGQRRYREAPTQNGCKDKGNVLRREDEGNRMHNATTSTAKACEVTARYQGNVEVA